MEVDDNDKTVTASGMAAGKRGRGVIKEDSKADGSDGTDGGGDGEIDKDNSGRGSGGDGGSDNDIRGGRDCDHEKYEFEFVF